MLPAQSRSGRAIGGGHAAVSAGVRPGPQPLPRLQPHLQVRCPASVDEIMFCSEPTHVQGHLRDLPTSWVQRPDAGANIAAVTHSTRRGGASEPETTSMTLTRAHELLIVATDGVWDAVTEAEAVNLVGDAATVAAGCQQARTVAPYPCRI